MQDNDLFIKSEKCYFDIDNMEFLDVIIGKDGVKMDLDKVHRVQKWLVPKKIKDMQAFLRLANFYKRFIKNFSKMARLLHLLTYKDTDWIWTEAQQNIFDRLKQAFTITSILVSSDTDYQMRIKSDASSYAMEAVLSMFCENGL